MLAQPISQPGGPHTHTSDSITDFDAAVRDNRLDQMAAPAGDVSLAGYKVVQLNTASESTDAVPLGQVQQIVSTATPNFDGGWF
jgi:hypothetical protein